MSKPEVCVIKTDGINCDEETMHAFEVTGGAPELVHINQLRNGEKKLKDYGILAIAGGFSYGDDVNSGQILATELKSYLSDQLQEFVDDGKPVFGICNGFQVLARTGLVPNAELGDQELTLTHNDSAQFGCRWVNLAIPNSVSRFVSHEDFQAASIPMQVAHGEGKLVGEADTITKLAANRQIVFQYATPLGTPTDTYPSNPNGSMGNIAGITDPTGLVLGMMPHPERSIEAFHEDRSRTTAARQAGEKIFKNIVTYAKEM